MLVENNRNLDLGHALKLAAAVQPLNIDVRTLDEVRIFIYKVISCTKAVENFEYLLSEVKQV